ncbi:adenosylcobinamide amidohydrolase [Acidianus sp. RZ1]|uniref:Coenzyme F390 synthetase n=1 Tax=Candidatus Acidianus copahuensis TaxID=1160895 RepID=A0A031LSY7_9CREN|nr:adenosylcobinamide amidohydrolase [Acidianus sp. RZ1]EZQ10880.1 coenzyme F390 synthetase [Candidatus Acidianus copahuensis]
MRRVIFELGKEYLTLTSALYPEGISTVRRVATLFVDKSYCSKDPWKDAVSMCNCGKDTVIFMTAAERYGYFRCKWGKLFISAGIGESGEDAGCTINIGIFVDYPLNINGLIDLIRTATEAKAGALRDSGFRLTGTVSDAIAVGSLSGENSFAGPGTPLGKDVSRSIRYSLSELILQKSNNV